MILQFHFHCFHIKIHKLNKSSLIQMFSPSLDTWDRLGKVPSKFKYPSSLPPFVYFSSFTFWPERVNKQTDKPAKLRQKLGQNVLTNKTCIDIVLRRILLFSEILVISGKLLKDEDEVRNLMEYYSPENQEAYRAMEQIMISRRWGHISALLADGRILTASGADEKHRHSFLSSSELFDPQTSLVSIWTRHGTAMRCTSSGCVLRFCFCLWRQNWSKRLYQQLWTIPFRQLDCIHPDEKEDVHVCD